MFVVVQQRVDGSLKLYFAKSVTIDLKNGGWITGIETSGHSFGFNIDQCKAATEIPRNEVSDPH